MAQLQPVNITIKSYFWKRGLEPFYPTGSVKNDSAPIPRRRLSAASAKAARMIVEHFEREGTDATP